MSAVRRRVFCDVQDGREKIVVKTVQDVEEIRRINEITRLANGSGTSSLWKKRNYVKIASIPLAVVDQWWQRGIRFTDPDAWPVIKKLLNDKDYEGLRTAPGRF
jgi:hypothetical protein